MRQKSGLRRVVAAGVALAAAAGCGPGAVTKSEKPGYHPGGHSEAHGAGDEMQAPTAPLLEGCTAWAPVTGAGVSIWAQTCTTQRLVADASGKSLSLETLDASGMVIDTGSVIEVFEVPADGLPGLTAALLKAGGAPAGATCALESAAAMIPEKQGVLRYMLAPTGATKATWERLVKGPDAPETPPCGRYGAAIVGDRFVQIDAGHPGKAVFVELGSEIQIYDPNTLTILESHSGGYAEDGKPKAGGH